MKILALDSSGLVASVAILEDDNLVAEYTIHYKKTHSQTLLPMLEEIKNMVDLELETIDYIAVAAGPGSFTGLRIGAATAKGLGLALKKPIVEVPTLEGLAYNLCGSQKLICPIMDARRNQVYTGLYQFQCNNKNWELKILQDQCAVDILDMIEKCNTLGKEVIFLGDGVPVYQEIIAKLMKVDYSFAPQNMNRQRAASVAVRGIEFIKAGKTIDAGSHQPEYLRKSQAEREREEANGKHTENGTQRCE